LLTPPLAVLLVSWQALWSFKESGRVEVAGHVLEGEEVVLKKEFKGASDRYQVRSVGLAWCYIEDHSEGCDPFIW
jgi:hypothetical protein